MATTVVHCRQPYDVYIGRPSKWGNPFIVGKDGTRQQVIQLYEQWFLGRPELIDALGELQGKRLGCWCAPLPCHGHVLARLAECVMHEDELPVDMLQEDYDVWLRHSAILHGVRMGPYHAR